MIMCLSFDLYLLNNNMADIIFLLFLFLFLIFDLCRNSNHLFRRERERGGGAGGIVPPFTSGSGYAVA